MKKAPPSDKEIDEAARQVCKIRNSTLWDETEFGKLTKYFTDLLYSGNLSKAERYLRRALCGNKQEQEDFLTEFSEKIKKGRCWPELSALTGDLVQ